MSNSDLLDSALVVFGHGTALNPNSSAPVLQHAAELRRRNVFGDVREAFWKQEPALLEVVQQARGTRVFLAPFFMSEGFFSEQVIPAALGFEVRNGSVLCRSIRRGDQTWIYCRPVGTHERVTSVILDRARSVLNQPDSVTSPDPAKITLFVAGHGTPQTDQSRQAVEYHAALIRNLGLFASVHTIYLDEEPRIPACFRLARTKHFVIVPFFVSDGLHVQEDIPVLLGQPAELVRERLRTGQPAWTNPTEKDGKIVWYSQSAGTNPIMAEIILARVHEAMACPGP